MITFDYLIEDITNLVEIHKELISLFIRSNVKSNFHFDFSEEFIFLSDPLQIKKVRSLKQLWHRRKIAFIICCQAGRS